MEQSAPLASKHIENLTSQSRFHAIYRHLRHVSCMFYTFHRHVPPETTTSTAFSHPSPSHALPTLAGALLAHAVDAALRAGRRRGRCRWRSGPAALDVARERAPQGAVVVPVEHHGGLPAGLAACGAGEVVHIEVHDL